MCFIAFAFAASVKSIHGDINLQHMIQGDARRASMFSKSAK